MLGSSTHPHAHAPSRQARRALRGLLGRTLALGTLVVSAVAGCTGDQFATQPGPTTPDVAIPAVPVHDDLASYLADSWTNKTDMPTARRGLVTATVNGFVYAIGGRSATEVNSRAVEAYNPGGTILTPKWAKKAQLPSARAWPSGASVINGKIYVAGGLNADGDPTKSLYVYDPATDTWATKTPMPVSSWGGASGVINGKLYVVTPGPTASKLHRYDPATNAWTSRAQGPAGHYYAVVGVIDGKLYLAGTMNSDETPSTGVAVYDPATNSWTAKAALNQMKIGMAGRVTGGKLYMVGGFEELNKWPVSALHAYNPATNAWVEKQHMPTSRGFLSLASSNGVLYALGGLAMPNVLVTNAAYNP